MNSIWIARDLNGCLCAYARVPERDDKWKRWHIDDEDENFCCLNSGWFPEITWETGSVELVIKGKED